MQKKQQTVSGSRLLLYIVCYGLVVVWLIPMLWMAATSFKPKGSPVTVLTEIVKPPYTMANYQYVMKHASIWTWTWNSTFIAVITTVVTILITSMAAYAISRIPFRGKTIVFWAIVGGLMIPVESLIVPLFQIMVDNDLINSFSAILLPGLAVAGPLGVLILKQFYDAIPNELVEAARIDGASVFRIWWSLFIPLSRSAMAALAIFTFLSSWNNFLWPFLAVSDEQLMTLPVGLPVFQNSYTGELTMPMAANMLAAVPALIVFIIFQKHIIKGITMTGIK